MRYVILSSILILLSSSCSNVRYVEAEDEIETLPNQNILLLVADDMGYADLGCYGSDILTPNIDALAAEGIRFSNFYSAPSCAPTRASLLSGTDNHTAGIGSQFNVTGDWGYEGHLSDRVITIPQLLTKAGYNTYMVGKWHLGGASDHLPNRKGFKQSFILTGGAGNHYNKIGFTIEGSSYRLNGDTIDWPKGAYSTDLYTDYIIEFIDSDRNTEKPFFVYAAYTSPHWPLQVDESYWKKYESNYVEGYEVLRKTRLQALIDTGIINDEFTLPPLHPNVTPWDSLSPDDQKIETRKMALYAGMLENLDSNIGRIISYLKEIGEYENTLILFMSDNGAAYRDFYNNPNWSHLKETYSNEYENMGSETSFVSYGPSWAEAGSAPFRYYKQYTYEGGIRTPMIIRSSTTAKGVINHNFVTLTDIAPTFYDYATIEHPKKFEGNKITSLPGRSIMPIINGASEEIHTPDETWIMEHANHVLVRKGEWKLVNPAMDWNEEYFELYNLDADPTESTDVKEQNPEIFEELMDAWKEFERDYQLIRFDED